MNDYKILREFFKEYQKRYIELKDDTRRSIKDPEYREDSVRSSRKQLYTFMWNTGDEFSLGYPMKRSMRVLNHILYIYKHGLNYKLNRRKLEEYIRDTGRYYVEDGYLDYWCKELVRNGKEIIEKWKI